MINPEVLKNFLSAILKEEQFLYPYLDSSMTVDESLITAGSVLLTYDSSIYEYGKNNGNGLSRSMVKSKFKISIIYQSLIQEDQSLKVYNRIYALINGAVISNAKQTPFRIIEDKLTQYKDRYGVFEHALFFETEYFNTEIVS
ncbi:MAG: hypothetical protein COT22_11390 [Ignavibacteria bacterium CG08_land_8_20_14_0_20_37_9]|nr:MAG: hypothetical protein COT22_11390 [Ignavibacteria bacterium CG08_land_8_20_14_0_20_37_9]PIX93035.1 MAG: hypothetical protein COZ25_12780 [Ignavibacteria bacterium CG_4_10_14_3_um_filter_37_18]PJC58788.1 MAG: hypothetical protein CO025_08320 [Ignavibacteria bacterium CG_4_9_14_0_2_um_filter_37_13]